jgi:hypothetical protein
VLLVVAQRASVLLVVAQRAVFMNLRLAKATQNLFGAPSGVKALPTCQGNPGE